MYVGRPTYGENNANQLRDTTTTYRSYSGGSTTPSYSIITAPQRAQHAHIAMSLGNLGARRAARRRLAASVRGNYRRLYPQCPKVAKSI